MSLADRIAVMNAGRIVQADRPVEVYRNPAARFVGAFIGNPPMNFLAAEAAGPGQWRVAGQLIPGPAAARERIEFAIRPEDMALGDGGIPASVRVVEPLGPHTLVTADVAGHAVPRRPRLRHPRRARATPLAGAAARPHPLVRPRNHEGAAMTTTETDCAARSPSCGRTTAAATRCRPRGSIRSSGTGIPA